MKRGGFGPDAHPGLLVDGPVQHGLGEHGLLTQVIAVDRHACGLPVALTDVPLDAVPITWSQARLASRASGCRTRRFLLVRRHDQTDITETNDVVLVRLPADLRMGDLLLIPSRIAAQSRVS
jgi:hypothetical protein